MPKTFCNAEFTFYFKYLLLNLFFMILVNGTSKALFSMDCPYLLLRVVRGIKERMPTKSQSLWLCDTIIHNGMRKLSWYSLGSTYHSCKSGKNNTKMMSFDNVCQRFFRQKSKESEWGGEPPISGTGLFVLSLETQTYGDFNYYPTG